MRHLSFLALLAFLLMEGCYSSPSSNIPPACRACPECLCPLPCDSSAQCPNGSSCTTLTTASGSNGACISDDVGTTMPVRDAASDAAHDAHRA